MTTSAIPAIWRGARRSRKRMNAAIDDSGAKSVESTAAIAIPFWAPQL